MRRKYTKPAVRICAARGWLIIGLILSVVIIDPSRVLAADAPACNDQDVLYKVRRAYEVALSTDKSAHQSKGEAVRELGYSGPNTWVNKHAPSKDYYHKSRYCEATMRLDNGQTEQTYFRIDALKAGEADKYNFDPCFINHQDASKDERLYQRPPKK